MKKILIRNVTIAVPPVMMLLLSFIINGAIAQTTTLPTTTNNFNSGIWNTNNALRFTRITVTNNLVSKKYRIQNVLKGDVDLVEFNVIVDNVTLPSVFFEGSTVVVEGKNIAIQQINKGAFLTGSWKVIQEADTLSEPIPWAIYSNNTKDALVASFKTEQDFVLSVRPNPNCSVSGYNVIIDGVAVKDNTNAVMVFNDASSIKGKGKSIVVRFAGACTALTTLFGDLYLKKTLP